MDTGVLIKLNAIDIQPKSGWKPFFSRLSAMGIDTLRDHSVIANYGAITSDAGGVTVEIAKPNSYRIYQYPNPDMNAGHVPEVAALLNIFRFIELETNAPIIR